MTGSPLLLEGKKTMAGEKGTASERSFVMVSCYNLKHASM